MTNHPIGAIGFALNSTPHPEPSLRRNVTFPNIPHPAFGHPLHRVCFRPHNPHPAQAPPSPTPVGEGQSRGRGPAVEAEREQLSCGWPPRFASANSPMWETNLWRAWEANFVVHLCSPQLKRICVHLRHRRLNSCPFTLPGRLRTLYACG